MKILIIHNHYFERGGEDEVVESEIKLLEKFGHKVILYRRSNSEIKEFNLLKKISLLTKEIIWSEDTYREIKKLIRAEKPDIAHIHNIFILVSPSVYYALSEENIPIVQTLHNYRLFCPAGVLYRSHRICEDCTGTNFIPSLIHRCWKHSFILTSAIARTLDVHFGRGTFREKIDTYITLSEFSKKKCVEKGLPDKKIFIKPNFVDKNYEERNDFQNFALFVGRLVDYKGVEVLIEAFKKVVLYELKIIGDGPLYKELKEGLKKTQNIDLLGRLPYHQTIEYIKRSSFLIFPTECYESTPRTVIECFNCGVPVLASDIGYMKELVQDGFSGMLFRTQNIDDLICKIQYLMTNRDLLVRMGKNARKVYEEKYTPEKNYHLLMDIYKNAISYAQNKLQE